MTAYPTVALHSLAVCDIDVKAQQVERVRDAARLGCYSGEHKPCPAFCAGLSCRATPGPTLKRCTRKNMFCAALPLELNSRLPRTGRLNPLWPTLPDFSLMCAFTELALFCHSFRESPAAT